MTNNTISKNDILAKDKLESSTYLLYRKEYRENLSNDAILMYQYILKRFSVSLNNFEKAIENDQLDQFAFIDENEKVFCYVSNDELCFVLNISEPTVKKCKKELSKAQLMFEVPQANKNNRIYLNKVVINSEDRTSFKKRLDEHLKLQKVKRAEKNKKRYEEKEKKKAEKQNQNNLGSIDNIEENEGNQKFFGSGNQNNLSSGNQRIFGRSTKEGFSTKESFSIEEEEEVITLDHVIAFIIEQITKREITNQKTITAIYEVASKCKAVGTTDWEAMQNYCITVIEDKMSRFGQKQSTKQTQKGKTPVRVEIEPEHMKEGFKAPKPDPEEQKQKKQEIEDMLQKLRA